MKSMGMGFFQGKSGVKIFGNEIFQGKWAMKILGMRSSKRSGA